MATRNTTPRRTRLAVAHRSPSPSPENFAIDWKPGSGGSGELNIAYEGPLAERREQVYARCGIWREGGAPWSDTREVLLRRDGPTRCVGSLKLPSGAPLQAVELAIRAGEDAWDNGGRAPLGYYEWKVGASELAVV